jgi:hypothetical protein
MLPPAPLAPETEAAPAETPIAARIEAPVALAEEVPVAEPAAEATPVEGAATSGRSPISACAPSKSRRDAICQTSPTRIAPETTWLTGMAA